MTKRQETSASPLKPDYKVVLKTERLYLRELIWSDLTFLVKLHQDPEVMKYIGPKRTKQQVQDRLNLIRSSYQENPGFGIWMACNKDSHECLGWACLKDLDGSDEIEIGYRLAKAYWGNGFATELARALLDYGFTQLRLPVITAVTREDNLASKHVLEKCGLIYQGMALFYNTDVLYFRISRDAWINSA